MEMQKIILIKINEMTRVIRDEKDRSMIEKHYGRLHNLYVWLNKFQVHYPSETIRVPLRYSKTAS